MNKQEALTLAVELIKNSDIAPENKANAAMDIADKFVDYECANKDKYLVGHDPFDDSGTIHSVTSYTSDTNTKAF